MSKSTLLLRTEPATLKTCIPNEKVKIVSWTSIQSVNFVTFKSYNLTFISELLFHVSGVVFSGHSIRSMASILSRYWVLRLQGMKQGSVVRIYRDGRFTSSVDMNTTNL